MKTIQELTPLDYDSYCTPFKFAVSPNPGSLQKTIVSQLVVFY